MDIEKQIAWFLKPLLDDLSELQIEPEDTFEKIEKTGSNIVKPKNTIYKPSLFLEYIGQEKAKSLLQRYIKASLDRDLKFPHTLIYGEAGSGKSTLARIISSELKLKIYETIASNIEDIKEAVDIIKIIKGGIYFIDEIHALERKTAEKFYPIMEDFKSENLYLNPFTLIGATTEIGEIIKDRKPLYDRFKIIIELEKYNPKELVLIAKQYKKKMFSKENLREEVYWILAKNCRNNPRTLIRLLEATVYFDGNIEEVLKIFTIIYNGLTLKDLQLLKYVASNEKGLGLSSIAGYLNTSAENYIYSIEPFLLQNELILRTARGRIITQKGLETIKKLNNEI
jgi:Holliday junction DNA helicase RuvB